MKSATMAKIDMSEILDYALRSQLAYNLNQLGWEIAEKIGWRMPTSYRTIVRETFKSQVNVVIEIDDAKKIQWIAVRGSSNLRNWILNFRYLQRSFFKNSLMHQGAIDLHIGFHTAANDVYGSILPHLRQDYQTRLTGHSLGGAIAVILMMFLLEDGYRVEKCITFGQPKVTDKKGAQMCQNLPLLRVINDEDIVPLVPPGTLLTQLQGGYHHFGERVILQSGKGYTYEDPLIQDQTMYSLWMRLFSAIAQKEIADNSDRIKDHDLRLYLLNIISNIESREPAIESLFSNLSALEAIGVA